MPQQFFIIFLKIFLKIWIKTLLPKQDSEMEQFWGDLSSK